jgi:hypothetical protein
MSKRPTGRVGLIAVALAGTSLLAAAAELSGPYLGQDPPGETAEVFAPGIVSTDKDQLNSVFTPDGKEFYFTNRENRLHTVMVMRQVDGKWTGPEVASFSGEHSSVDMSFSHDGRQVFFGSQRPRPGEDTPRRNWDIWTAERQGDGWSEPRFLGPVINGGDHQVYPTATRDGTLYFQADRETGFGRNDVYRSRFVDGAYTEPENLGPAINTEFGEGDVFIAPDESYLIVSVTGREDSHGNGDLYISFRQPDGSWSAVKNMGKSVNTDKLEYCPMVSPDGKYLFFTSTRSGNGDIYWMDAKVIEDLR